MTDEKEKAVVLSPCVKLFLQMLLDEAVGGGRGEGVPMKAATAKMGVVLVKEMVGLVA